MRAALLLVFGLGICAFADAAEVRHVPRTKVEAKILSTLDTEFDFDFENVPLQKILNSLGEKLSIPIDLRVAALDAIALSPDMEVTIHMKGGTVEAGLEKMLNDCDDLCFVVTPKALVVTSIDDVAEESVIRVYDAGKFVGLTAPDSDEEEDVAELAELVRVLAVPEALAHTPEASAAGPMSNVPVSQRAFPPRSAWETETRVEVFGRMLIVKAPEPQQKLVQSLLSQVYAGLMPDSATESVERTASIR